LAILSLDTSAALVDVQHLMECGEIARRIAPHYQHVRLAARGKTAGHISNPD
jgi:hypothetical protein